MKNFEMWLLAYLVNALWQIPVVFLAAWGAARLGAKAGPRVEHRIWAVALLGETVLPACRWSPADLWRRVTELLALGSGAKDGYVRIVLGPGVGGGSGALHVPEILVWIVITAFAGCALYCAGRMAWGLMKTRRTLCKAEPLRLDGERAQSWVRLQRTFAFAGDAPELAVAHVAGPVTVGVRRRVLLAPREFVESVSIADFEALVAHEFAHMVRHDFTKNLLYGVIALPAAWHPAVWLTRARLAESRERVCDAMAAAAVAGQERYARSLLRLASTLSQAAPAVELHGMGIFDSRDFERRIMDLTGNRVEIRGARRLIVVALCGVIGLAACTSAMALRVGVDEPAQNAKQAPKRVEEKNLKLLSHVFPTYPAKAKADHVAGTVLLDAIIGKDGTVENVKVKQSLREDCDSSSIEAIKQWKYQPVLLNGEPIEVETTITVNFSLAK